MEVGVRGGWRQRGGGSVDGQWHCWRRLLQLEEARTGGRGGQRGNRTCRERLGQPCHRALPRRAVAEDLANRPLCLRRCSVPHEAAQHGDELVLVRELCSQAVHELALQASLAFGLQHLAPQTADLSVLTVQLPLEPLHLRGRGRTGLGLLGRPTALCGARLRRARIAAVAVQVSGSEVGGSLGAFGHARRRHVLARWQSLRCHQNRTAGQVRGCAAGPQAGRAPAARAADRSAAAVTGLPRSDGGPLAGRHGSAQLPARAGRPLVARPRSHWRSSAAGGRAVWARPLARSGHCMRHCRVGRPDGSGDGVQAGPHSRERQGAPRGAGPREVEAVSHLRGVRLGPGVPEGLARTLPPACPDELIVAAAHLREPAAELAVGPVGQDL
mmetsp:Transcript_75940/g.245929  ORF Transcript_75940/g.245929 Transcript_75940/m.245929 type:complete len:385 (-) Transcript_75940:1018-2172(-)